MRLHASARLSVKGRELLVERIGAGWSLTEAAAAAAVSERTAREWRDRHAAEGSDGLVDRSSAPRSVPARTSEERIEAIAALRRLRFTGAEIAELFGMGAVDRLGDPHPSRDGQVRSVGPRAVQRDQRERPGELIHVDVKKLGCIKGGAGKRITGVRRHHQLAITDPAGRRRKTAGWDFVHVAVDDATRLAYVEVLNDEKGTTAVAFLRHALKFFLAHAITVEAVLTDNGSPYRSAIHALACRRLRLEHLRTRPYRPQTNGKAERFIRTMPAGWAYGAIYRDSHERTAALPGWLDHYNYRRPHASLSHQPPASRPKQLTANNLLGSYT